jgi:hypothetical protein
MVLAVPKTAYLKDAQAQRTVGTMENFTHQMKEQNLMLVCNYEASDIEQYLRNKSGMGMGVTKSIPTESLEVQE